MTVTRVNTITYAGLTLGAGTSYHLHDVHMTEREYDESSLRFKVVVHHATDATFQTLCTALEDAFQTPFGALVISIAGNTWLSVSHTANTGFNGRPRIRTTPTHRSNNSRCYECEVSFQQPSTLSGKNGQSSADIQIDTDDSGLLTVTISATYTALPADTPSGGDAARSATEVIDAFFGTYVTSVTGTFSGITFDTTDAERVQRGAENKVATVTKTLREILDPESEGATDEVKLVRPQYTVQVFRQREQAGDGAQPLTQALITYQASVPKGQSTDLEDVYENTVKPKIRAKAEELFGDSLEILAERPSYDPVNNRVFAFLSLAAAESQLIAINVTTQTTTLWGRELVPVADGGKFSKDLHDGFGIRTRQIQLEVFATAAGASLVDSTWRRPFDDVIAASVAEGYTLKAEFDSDEGDAVPLTIGLEGGISVVRRGRTALLEYGVVAGNSGQGDIVADSNLPGSQRSQVRA